MTWLEAAGVRGAQARLAAVAVPRRAPAAELMNRAGKGNGGEPCDHGGRPAGTLPAGQGAACGDGIDGSGRRRSAASSASPSGLTMPRSSFPMLSGPSCVCRARREPFAAAATRRHQARRRPMASATGDRGAAGGPLPGHDRILFLASDSSRLRADRQGEPDIRTGPASRFRKRWPLRAGRADGFLIPA